MLHNDSRDWELRWSTLPKDVLTRTASVVCIEKPTEYLTVKIAANTGADRTRPHKNWNFLSLSASAAAERATSPIFTSVAELGRGKLLLTAIAVFSSLYDSLSLSSSAPARPGLVLQQISSHSVLSHFLLPSTSVTNSGFLVESLNSTRPAIRMGTSWSAQSSLSSLCILFHSSSSTAKPGSSWPRFVLARSACWSSHHLLHLVTTITPLSRTISFPNTSTTASRIALGSRPLYRPLLLSLGIQTASKSTFSPPRSIRFASSVSFSFASASFRLLPSKPTVS